MTDPEIASLLNQLYGAGAASVQASLEAWLARHTAAHPPKAAARQRLPLTAADVMLITYGD